ncbi:SGNH/GDSL hydrolase family protein [Pelagibacteraceae bacterium]|jgi:lysophospholipase L1-like esterase|nr:SGNH/GDSL hydrolase family protein [Pelagibacteraceae bacterium]
MLKKISFFLLINLIIFISIEIIVRTTLKALHYPQVYKIGNIGKNHYDYLTGFYNLPNIRDGFGSNISEKKRLEGDYRQGTDQYGFNLDGKRFVSQDLSIKDDNVFRIFLLGGSTVQGRALTDRYDPVSARLEKILNEKMGDSKLSFQVINAATSSFILSQELALIQYKILYALKSDYIIILNGTNDSISPLGDKFYISNSHFFQRQFQNNLTRSSKNFFFFFDDWLSENVSTYFLLKKIIEKTTGIFLFDAQTRKFAENEMSKKKTKDRIYKYFYNIDLVSNLASKETYISFFFQPQMLPNSIKKLSDNDQKIFSDFNKKEKLYFPSKQLFYDIARDKIKSNNSSVEFKSKKYFQLIDMSNLLESTENSKDYYSDYVHYTPTSREIIAEKIFQNIEKKIEEKLNN